MHTSIRIAAAIAGICAAGLTACSFYMASFVTGGKRQTLSEAMKWQTDHYDISWYEKIKKKDYQIQSYDGYSLHMELLECEKPSDRYMILSHGYTDNRYGSLKYAKMYLDLGFHCIIYDLRGHGENEKAFCSYSVRESRDLSAIIDDTYHRYGEEIVLGLHGESLGAATTVGSLAFTKRPAFAVADCGFARISPILRNGLKAFHLPGWLLTLVSAASRIRYGISFEEMSPVEALKGNEVPLLLIHGEKDDFISPENSMEMQKTTAGYSELHLIPDAGHALSMYTHPDQYAEIVRCFLEKAGIGA